MSENSIEKLWLSGNEAFALGAYEAGVTVASGYPGTPSTEILENFAQYDGIYTEWAPNEKVALEVTIGASFAGARALATMKHVGVNVAADPLFTVSYTGVRGGLVIIAADDPEMHSSQNEQDTRNYAYAAKLPMFEPSDPAEAREFMKLAYDISEIYDTPVLVRSTTRVSHVKGRVKPETRETPPETSIQKDPAKLVMLPANARRRRTILEDRHESLVQFSESCYHNRIEWGDRKIGFITSGISYLYTKEAFPEASIMKLGMIYPFPEKMIRDFAEEIEKLYIIEELDPFIETHVKAMGIRCTGKKLIPAVGELNTSIIKKAITGKGAPDLFTPAEIPMRPPNMCPGCPHRGLFYCLSRLDVFVSGDIGCYTLGFLPPLSAMDSCVCMGASIGVAHGMAKALGDAGKEKIVAVLGDSTFCHSGITGLVNMVYNKSYATVIILDNRITGMTGHQQNPASGKTLMGEPAHAIDLEALCQAVGVKHIATVNPLQLKQTKKALKEAIEHDGPSVVIAQYPCALLPEEKKKKKTPYSLQREDCNGCTSCLRIGCPSISWTPVTPEEGAKLGYKEKQKGYAQISETCNGCGLCAQLCKSKAICKTKEAQA